MSAHRNRKKKIRLIKPKWLKSLPAILALIFFSIIFFRLFFRSDNFANDTKTSLVIKNGDSSISVIVFDPRIKEIHTLIIPGNTEIDIAGGYGKWKIKSIWQLGEQEGLDGDLLARSVTRGLKMPTFLWADSRAGGLVSPRFSTIIPALFSPYKSNLSLGDKLGMLILSLQVKNTKRVTINLQDTLYLDRAMLSDGEEAYVISASPAQYISAIFADPYLSGNVVRVAIKNASGEPGLAEEVSKIIEVLGAKVSSIEKAPNQEGRCILIANDENLLKSLKKLFGCDASVGQIGNFDLEITLGEKFADYY